MESAPHLRIFGSPELRGASGQPLRFRTRKQLGLLVYLALEAQRRPVSRERLIELLWSDVPRDRARHSLSQGLTAIRARLGAPAVSRERDSVRLTGGLCTDLDLLKRGEEAPGDLTQPLKDLDDIGAPSFAHWVDGVRIHCLDTVREVLLKQLQAARSQGKLQQVNERAAQLYGVDPLSDVAAHALAERSLLAGDTVGAIRMLRKHLAQVRKELQCDPQPDVARLLRRLERGAVRPLREQQPSPAAPITPRHELFVGRERQMARLEALWAGASAGGLKTILVTGPPGIGKSSLIHRFATSVAARAWPALEVSCQEIGKNIPFAAVSDLIHALARDPAVSGTDPQWLAEATRVTPGLRTVYPGVPEPPVAPAESIRLRVAEALLRMLDAVADGGPTLLVFDDLQHMDPASRDVLHVLARRLSETPTLLLGAARTDGVLQGAKGVAQGTEGVTWNDGIALGPLASRPSRQLTVHLGAAGEELSEPLVAKTAELSEGNPYLIEMLIWDWRQNAADCLVAIELRGDRTSDAWRPPETMHRAFARQYDGLSRDARHLLHLLAVAGRNVAQRQLARLAGMALAAADQAALELIERGILMASGGTLAFKNELHRAFVYYAMSHEARTYHHARLAQSLNDTRHPQDFQRALEASHHFLKGGMVEEATEAVSVGADLAVTRGAPTEAERALRSVIAHCTTRPAQRLHLLLAKALNSEGRYQESVNALSNWQVHDPNADDEALAATIRAEALHRGRLSDDKTIAEVSARALRLAESCGDETLQVRALQVSVEVAAETSDLGTLAAGRSRAARLAKSSGADETRAMAQLTQGYCHLVAAESDAASAHLRNSVRLLDGLSLDPESRLALNLLAVALFNTGSYREAISSLRRALQVALRIGDSTACAVCWSSLGVVYEDLGKITTAEQCYTKAVALASNPRRACEIHVNLAGLMILVGDFTRARQSIEIAKQQGDLSQLWWLQRDALLIDADYHIARGNPESAWPLVEEAQAVARGRTYALAGIARFRRLMRHHLWATKGVEAMMRFSQNERAAHLVAIRGRLEVRALEEWVRRLEGLKPRREISAFEELRRRQLHGTLAYLRALHITDTE